MNRWAQLVRRRAAVVGEADRLSDASASIAMRNESACAGSRNAVPWSRVRVQECAAIGVVIALAASRWTFPEQPVMSRLLERRADPLGVAPASPENGWLTESKSSPRRQAAGGARRSRGTRAAVLLLVAAAAADPDTAGGMQHPWPFRRGPQQHLQCLAQRPDVPDIPSVRWPAWEAVPYRFARAAHVALASNCTGLQRRCAVPSGGWASGDIPARQGRA